MKMKWLRNLNIKSVINVSKICLYFFIIGAIIFNLVEEYENFTVFLLINILWLFLIIMSYVINQAFEIVSILKENKQ